MPLSSYMVSDDFILARCWRYFLLPLYPRVCISAEDWKWLLLNVSVFKTFC